MHLREIRINGFTSYASDVSLGNINPGVNVVVGRNGAGKSNFFRAIQFVLGGPQHNDFHQIRSFGSRKQITVEVVLGNTGDRFFHLGDTVSITRKVGSSDDSGTKNEDRYFIDDRHVSKSEATSLLNAAGLSTDSGSYYIVPQGSIHQLASASDEEMLTILCNASGAASFDDRIAKSKLNLTNASSKIQSSTEITSRIEPIVNRMARDVENLQERRKLTKELRGKKFALSKLELLRTNFAIERESAMRNGLQSGIEESNAELREHEYTEQRLISDLADAEAKLAEVEVELETAEGELRQRKHDLNSSRMGAIDVESIEVDIPASEIDEDEEFRELVSSQESLFSSSLGSQYSSVSSSHMNSSEDDSNDNASDTETVEIANSRLHQLRERLVAKVSEISSVKAKLLNLQLKEGRAKQLSPEEFASYQQKEIARVEQNIEGINRSLNDERSRVQQLELKRAHESENLKTVQSEHNGVTLELNKLNGELEQLEKKKAQTDSLKSNTFLTLRKSEIQRSRQYKAAEQQIQIISNGVGGTGRLDMARSIEKVQNSAKQLQLTDSQYFGTLAEVLNIDGMVTDVVDRLALRQLFFHIVDSSETISKLVEMIGTEVSATFVPLAQLIVPPIPQYPSKEQEPGVSPLVDWVSPVKEEFIPVRDYVFGRYLICENLETALRTQQKYNLPAVTLDGDICDTSGTISGGFSSSGDGAIGNGEIRINAIRDVGSLYRSVSQLDDVIVSSKQAITTETQRSVQISDMISAVKVKIMHATIRDQNQLGDVADLQEHVSLLDKQIADCNQVISDCEADLSAATQEKMAVSQRESFASALTNEDREMMTSLTQHIATLTESCQALAKEEVEVFTKRMRAIHKRNKMNAARKLNETNHSAITDDVGASRNVNELRSLYDTASGNLEKVESELAKAQATVDKLSSQVQNAHKATEKLSEKNKELMASAHHITTKISVLSAFASKITHELDQIGAISASAAEQVERFTAMYDANTEPSTLKNEVQKLDREAHRIQKELDKLEPVDPKVASEREQLLTDLEQLQQNIAVLNSERDSVVESIKTLELQKSAKLTESITKISSKFGEIFHKLSGGHTGSLEIEYNDDDEQTSVTRVSLNVSFGETTNQLSGGQRTICALAIIFAIQSCDSAPFYIFDEIDSNLDSNARLAVASMISSLSKSHGVQFICTTFHPELVNVSDACFGVSYQHKKSVIEPIDRTMAVEFTSSD